MYATQQDLIDLFGETEVLQLADRDGVGAADPKVLTRALTDAGAAIDGYLASRYRLPLATVPAALVRVTCDLARYYLCVAPEDTVKDRYTAAVRFLQAVAKGEVNLGPTVDGSAPPVSDGALMTSGGRIWDRDQAKGFV